MIASALGTKITCSQTKETVNRNVASKVNHSQTQISLIIYKLHLLWSCYRAISVCYLLLLDHLLSCQALLLELWLVMQPAIMQEWCQCFSQVSLGRTEAFLLLGTSRRSSLPVFHNLVLLTSDSYRTLFFRDKMEDEWLVLCFVQPFPLLLLRYFAHNSFPFTYRGGLSQLACVEMLGDKLVSTVLALPFVAVSTICAIVLANCRSMEEIAWEK